MRTSRCPAASMAAATRVAGAAPATVPPSIRMVEPGGSLQAAGGTSNRRVRNGVEVSRRQGAGGDQRRQHQRMVGGERHPAMAGRDEGAGTRLRLVIDRKSVLGSSRAALPRAHDIEPAEERKHPHRTIGHDREHRLPTEASQPASSTESPIITPPSSVCRMVWTTIIHERCDLLGDDDLAALRANRGVEAEHGGEARIPQPGGKHDPARRELGRCRVQAELARARLDALDGVVRAIAAAQPRKPHMQRMQQPQCVHMAIERDRSLPPPPAGRSAAASSRPRHDRASDNRSLSFRAGCAGA